MIIIGFPLEKNTQATGETRDTLQALGRTGNKRSGIIQIQSSEGEA